MIGKIYINGQIGTFDGVKGVELIDVIGQVKAQPEATSFEVHINSEGGVVDTGLDIFNYLKSLGKQITTIGSGIVASIATVIFMAGDVRKIMPNTPFMIHLPWGGTQGSSEEIKEFAEQLEAYEKKLIDFYKKHLDLSDEAIRPLLREETWLSEEQLTTLGFTTLAPIQVAAIAKFNIDNKNDKPMSNQFTDKDRHWMESLFEKVLGKFKAPVLNKVVQDATGTSLDFTDLADDAVIEVGEMATVDGNPADGEYTMPDETTYVFVAGELTEIRPAEGDGSELDVANARIAELEEELETERTARASVETQVDDIKQEVVALKKNIMSKFKITDKKETKKVVTGKVSFEERDRGAGAREYLNSKKGK